MKGAPYRGRMEKRLRVIIVGGGIAGPAASLLLQQAGHEPLIFEAYPEPTTIGGGFQIAPNGMRVLQVLGLDRSVASAGAPAARFAFRNEHGRHLGHIDVARSGYGVTILRAAFHRILLDETRRRGVDIVYGKRLGRIEQTDTAVAAHFEDGSVVEGDVLLAADGVHSRARALIFPDYAKPRYTGFVGVGGFSGSPAVQPDEEEDLHQLNFTVGSRLQFGYATVSAAKPHWGWWTHLPQEAELSRQDLQTISDDAMRARVLEAFRGWHAPIEAFVSTTSQIMRTAIYDVPSLPAWHVGRVMLLGDAAHAMSPAGGQGASLALEDALLVARGLVQRSTAVSDVFTEVESLLRVRAERIVRQAAQNDLRQLKRLGAVGQWIRDRMFPLFLPVIARDMKREYAALASRADQPA